MEQLTLFGEPEAVDKEALPGRCDWAPAPWERENLWPARLEAAAGREACDALWGDVPRMTRLRVDQVCRRLACDSTTVYRLIEQGEFDAVNIGAGHEKPTWRIYRYSLIWFLFRREFLAGAAGAESRPAAAANIGQAAADGLVKLAREIGKEGCARL